MVFLFSFETVQDEEKFHFLYTKYKNLLLHKAYSILQDSMLAEDAVSEAYIRIYKNIHKIDNPESGRTIAFIVTIVKNTALTLLQNKKDKATELLEDIYQDDFNLEEAVINQFDAKRVYTLLEQMNEDLKSVFILKYAYDLDHKEIGKVLGLTPNNVTVKLHRATKKLAQLLEKEGDCNGTNE